MATIDIKLKTYEQLQFEIMKLNTDIVLRDKEIERLNNIIDKLEKYIVDEGNDNNKLLISRITSESGKERIGIENCIYDDILDKLKELKEGK